MAESQYIESYLDAAEAHRWTPETYLHHTLRGKAKSYSDRYSQALMRAIKRRIDTGEVIAIPSARGSTAYVRTGVETPADPIREDDPR